MKRYRVRMIKIDGFNLRKINLEYNIFLYVDMFEIMLF